VNDARYLRGLHAIVTGGGRGIGAAVASELAQLGANLTLMGRDEEALTRHAENVRGAHGVEAVPIRCDVTDEENIRAAFAAAHERFGDAYVLVNNAGVAESARFATMPRELWDRHIATNLTSVFLCMQQVLPAMLARRAGRIVNIASVAGLHGGTWISAYSASKHGVIGLTRSVALEAVKHGVTVNAVCPGYVETDMTQRGVDTLVRARGVTAKEATDMILRTIPRGTLIQPNEVSSVVAWLCSPHASAVTGQAIVVAGGDLA